MKHVTLEALPISKAVRRQIRDEPRIHGAVMDGETIVVWGPKMDIKSEAGALARLPTASHAWVRERAPQAGGTRVQQAMALMAAEGITANAAAVRVGVDVAAVYRAIKLRAVRETCPTCGQVLP